MELAEWLIGNVGDDEANEPGSIPGHSGNFFIYFFIFLTYTKYLNVDEHLSIPKMHNIFIAGLNCSEFY
jgi:hypothetical protein